MRHMKADSYKLKNGLNTILVDTEAFPSLTTLLFIGAGSRYETRQNNGIAHFFEHMAFKGSNKYPSAQTLAAIIEGKGGIFNAFTSVDHTGYFVKAPAQDAETVVDVIADMIQNPLLKEEEINREKGVIVQEINMYEDMPQRRVYELFETLLYPKHPLGFDIIGTKKNVMGFTRKTFMDYIDQLYHPNNAVLVLAGGLTSVNGRKLQDYKDMIDVRFSGWGSKTPLAAKSITENQKKPALMIQYKKSEQAHFCLGYRTFSRFDDRKYTLSVLSAILGSGMSSRLFREVRERRGLCYAIKTYTDFYDDAGYVVTYAGVEPQKGKISEAIKVILQEHRKLADTGVTDKELKLAKEMIKGHLILSLEDTFNVASLYGRKMLFEKDVLAIKDIIKSIDAVKKADVKKLAQEIFKQEALNLAFIGPFSDEKAFEKLLG